MNMCSFYSSLFSNYLYSNIKFQKSQSHVCFCSKCLQSTWVVWIYTARRSPWGGGWGELEDQLKLLEFRPSLESNLRKRRVRICWLAVLSTRPSQHHSYQLKLFILCQLYEQSFLELQWQKNICDSWSFLHYYFNSCVVFPVVLGPELYYCVYDSSNDYSSAYSEFKDMSCSDKYIGYCLNEDICLFRRHRRSCLYVQRSVRKRMIWLVDLAQLIIVFECDSDMFCGKTAESGRETATSPTPPRKDIKVVSAFSDVMFLKELDRFINKWIKFPHISLSYKKFFLTAHLEIFTNPID